MNAWRIINQFAARAEDYLAWLGPRIPIGYYLIVAALLAPGIFASVIGFDYDRLQMVGVMGSWLQGFLTPALLAVAAFSFRGQSTAQGESNRISAQATFIENVDRFAGHFDYRCACVLTNLEPSRSDVPPGECLDAVRGLLLGPGRRIFRIGNHYVARGPLEIRQSRYYPMLIEEIEQIVVWGEHVEMLGFLDGRIRGIHELVKTNPPLERTA
jgi:hypothetical protein